MITATAWIGTVAAVLVLIALELLVAARRPDEPRFGEAVAWSLSYVVVAIAFGAVLGLTSGWELGEEYFAGFIVEKSLSIDNLFVFVIIVGSFAVPSAQRSRAVTIGILAALVLRCLFIALGAALIARFSVTFAIFGAILILTAVQMLRRRGEESSAHGSALAERLRRLVPITTEFDGGRLFSRSGGRRAGTPMLLVLIVMGATDALFALDSIPAVYGITDHPYVVFAANAFALLGMRPLYFLVAGLVQKLIYLTQGMAAILVFIGAKLIVEFLHDQIDGPPEIGTAVSLLVIAAILGTTAAASLLRTRGRKCGHDPMSDDPADSDAPGTASRGPAAVHTEDGTGSERVGPVPRCDRHDQQLATTARGQPG